MRILLADDSELILERLQAMVIAFKNVEIVGSFNNGIDALKGIILLNPDIAIVDIKMPGINGLEVLIQTRKINESVIFIILTSLPSTFYRQSAIKNGANYFINKEDGFDKIEQVIIELLEIEKISMEASP